MKRILFIIGILVCARPCFATWTEVNHVSCGATGAANTCTTAAISTTTANLIQCYASYYDAVTTAANSDLTDSASNSWTAVQPTPFQSSGDSSQRISAYRVIGPSTGGSHTFTVTIGSASSVSLVCFAMTQGSNPSVDGSPVSSQTTSGTGPTTIQAGSLGSANDLVFSGVAFYANNSQSIDSSFATPIEVGYSITNHVGLAVSWKEVSGAVNPTWSVSGNNSGTEVSLAVAYTGTGGGGATCNGGMLLRGAGGCH